MPFDEAVDQRSGGRLWLDLTERRARGESLEDATAALVQLAERRIDPTPVQPGRRTQAAGIWAERFPGRRRQSGVRGAADQSDGDESVELQGDL